MAAVAPEFNWRDLKETGTISTPISPIADLIGDLIVTVIQSARLGIQSMRLLERCKTPRSA
jgi:hypothetical protein